MTTPRHAPGVATLGDLTFSVGPSQIAWDYHMDSTVINTIGGQVVQVYGATLGDMTIQGLFGIQMPDKTGPNTRKVPVSSMQQAKNFAMQIAQMVDKQGARPSNDQLTRKDKAPMHQPFRFTYTGDGVRSYDFSVYIKSLSDVNDPQFVVSHKTGRYLYGYTLTCFIVEDRTGELTQIAADDYIQRLTQGVGWQRTKYNGPMTEAEVKAYLSANSPDGTIHGLILKEYEDAAKGKIPDPGTIAPNPIPGGAATASAADAATGGDGRGTGGNPGSSNPKPVPKPGDPNFTGPVLPKVPTSLSDPRLAPAVTPGSFLPKK